MKVLKLLGILVVIPVLAFAVAMYYEYTLDISVQEMVQTKFPDLSKEQLAEYTVENFIFHSDVYGTVDFETEVYVFVVMKYASIVTTILGLFLVGAALVLARIASRSRDLLGLIFPATVTVSTILVSFITIVNGFLLVGALYYGESAIIGVVHYVIIGTIGLGAVIGSFLIVRSLLSAFKRSPLLLDDEAVASETPIYKMVEDVAARLKTQMPDFVILGQSSTFFVYQGTVSIQGREHEGRVLYLSREISGRLGTDELSSIIAHEFAHFIGKDLDYTTRFHFAYIALGQALARLGNEENFWMALSRMPAIGLLDFISFQFGQLERKNSRERELVADRMAFENYGTETFGTSLAKVVLLMQLVEKARYLLVADLRKANPEEDPSDEDVNRGLGHKVSALASSDLSEYRKELNNQQFPHPFDTHPTLSERLSNAGLDTDQIVNKVTA